MDCLFCKIIKGEIPSIKLFEDNRILAFQDINPEAPTHFLVISKKHISSLSEANKDDLELLGYIQLKIAEIAESLEITKEGYRVVTNVGIDGGQTVSHLHYHILAGRAMKWPPG